MNPSGGEKQPQFEYPIPSGGEAGADQAVERGAVSSPENRPQKQPIQVASQAASDLALPAGSMATDQTAAANDSAQATPAQGTQTADSDRIEKAWIDRTDSVIAQTKGDPFAQKNEIEKISAEYIKHKYGKTIKTDDPVGK